MTVAVCAEIAAAQLGGPGLRIYQEQLRVRLDQQQAAAKEVGVDVGGWLVSAFLDYEDKSGRKTRTLRQNELRLWGTLSFAGVHQFYVRGLFGYDDWNTGDNPNGNRGDDWNDELERAWYQFDYNRLVFNRTGQYPALGLKVQVGREYHTIGSGLTLALPLDAVRIDGHVGNWALTALLAQTITHTPNIDDSDVVADHMDRCFYGLELRYTGLDRHEPYVYYLFQRDHTDEWGSDPLADYTYHSDYLGIGSGGSVLLPNLRYGWELVFEHGEGFPRPPAHRREDVHAMALDVLVEYFFNLPSRPRIQFEYLWGSGDSDRETSANSTIGGNRPGTDDNAFNAFGFRDTGLAFSPGIANLHIFEVGASATPFRRIRALRKMEIGTKLFFYAKDESRGAITDPLGTRHDSWVGWEWDVFCNWRLASDLSLTARYGTFQPGDAFDSDSCRHFIYAALNYSF
ncbi:MAG: alginate export family protein [Planctomycetota bacterium]